MKPMLAKTAGKDFIDKRGYIYEPKLDGIRAILHYGKRISFRSRNEKDITERFSNIDLSTIKAKSCIIDGEIVAYDKNGNPNFSMLQNGKNAVFVAFDIVEKNWKDLSHMPLMKRKKILDKTFDDNDSLQRVFYTEKGKKLWQAMKDRNLEGIMAKKKDSRYQEGVRSDSWLKIKLTNTIDCIITGFTSEKRKISSLALSLYKDKRIIFVGKVGTGFSEKFISDFEPKLNKIRQKKPSQNGITPVKPKYVAEIEYLEFTGDQKLRAPVFKRLREDKDLSECGFPGNS